MDYATGVYTVINTVTGASRGYRITNRTFKLPGDNMVIVTDDLINKIREELKC
jgi:signal peptidase I